MLTLSFIHDFAQKKKKTLSRKLWTEKQKHSQDPIFKQRNTPHRKPCVQKFSTNKFYTEEIMSVSAVPSEESNK